MNNIKVSLIIPVYNAEKFLEKNLIVLSKQTLDEVEFICVNDSSTDNSLNILKAFKQVFPERFVVINSERNRGPGGARNIGLSYARGEYIGFLDCDDAIHPDMLKEMYNEAKSGDFDIVSCGYYDKASGKDIFPLYIKGMLDEEKRYDYMSVVLYIWNKMFKRTLLEKMDIHFRENIKYEDTDFTIEAVLGAEKVSTVNKVFYYYNYNNLSSTKNGVFCEESEYKAVSQMLESIEKRCKNTLHTKAYEKIKNAVAESHIRTILMIIFYKPYFSLEVLKRFDEFTKKYIPEYYKIKYDNEDDMEKRIFNRLSSDVAESYNNLFKLKCELVKENNTER